MTSYIEDRRYFPTGYDQSNEMHEWNISAFTVFVTYRGNGKWMVSRSGREPHVQLSATGRWLWMPLKMTQMRWCRFDFETACRLADEVVDSVVINGRTWQQVLDWWAEK